jgi:hypothetical protein
MSVMVLVAVKEEIQKIHHISSRIILADSS